MEKERSLQFAPMVPGEPTLARCTECRRVFIDKTYGTERDDDQRILGIRKQFEAHHCIHFRPRPSGTQYQR